jgi:galactokinase
MIQVPTEVAQRISAAGARAFGDGWAASRVTWAPGRIELIGNHLDYNGGPVLAAAIDRGIFVASGLGPEGSVRAVFPDVRVGRVKTIADLRDAEWRSNAPRPAPLDYLRGVIAALNHRGYGVQPGSELVVAGNLPHGIGISSSAALCVGLCRSLALRMPEPPDLVLLAQEAEHRAGSPCGTMDQSASVFGGLIQFDGATNEVKSIGAELGEIRLLVANSGVVRSLATSAYPERVRETRQAVEVLRKALMPELKWLAEIVPEQLTEAEQALRRSGMPELARRLRHVVSETFRVRQAQAAVASGDWRAVGELMTASGRSSATDYEISHPEVERLVSLCLTEPGVLGARMMGGGQGGSALVLTAGDAIDRLTDRLDRDYFGARSGDVPEVRTIPCRFAEGAGDAAMP